MPTPLTTPLTSADPVRVQAYPLTGRLREDDLGIVYLARDGRGGQVAVKLMHAWAVEDAVARERFVREMRLVERVAGPGVVRVLDSGVDGERVYVVSEHVIGPTLEEWLHQAGPLDPRSLMRLAIGTAAALAAIHRAGIAYRAFGPSNVLIAPDGPRVTGFGMADMLCWLGNPVRRVVERGRLLTPEWVEGGTDGLPGDMFAWASTVVFAATGGYPFDGDSAVVRISRLLWEEPDLPPLPPALAGAVAACLAKDPARRPSGDAVVRGLLG